MRPLSRSDFYHKFEVTGKCARFQKARAGGENLFVVLFVISTLNWSSINPGRFTER